MRALALLVIGGGSLLASTLLDGWSDHEASDAHSTGRRTPPVSAAFPIGADPIAAPPRHSTSERISEASRPARFEAFRERQATIRTVDVERVGDQARLLIEANDRIAYRLEPQDDSRRLEISIEAATTEDPTAEMDFGDTPIRSIRTRSLGRRTILDVTFDTPQNVRSHWAQSDSRKILVIELEARDVRMQAGLEVEELVSGPSTGLQIERSASDRARSDHEASRRAADESTRAGRAAYDEGDSTKAIAHYRTALEVVPGHRRALFDAASVLIELERLDDAIALVRTAREGEPDDAGLLMLHAQLVERTGDVAAAIQMLDRVAGDRLDAPDVQALAAAYLQQAGEHELAINRYEALVRRHPGQAHWWMGLGISLEASGRDADALDVYRIAMQVGELPAKTRRWVSARVEALGKEG